MQARPLSDPVEVLAAVREWKNKFWRVPGQRPVVA